MDGEPTRMGFFTNRIVRAQSPEEAEQAAIQLLREDSKLRDLLNDPGDPPMIYTEDLFELEPQPPEVPQQQGFVFYPEELDA
jgi:hypothetical protein